MRRYSLILILCLVTLFSCQKAEFIKNKRYTAELALLRSVQSTKNAMQAKMNLKSNTKLSPLVSIL